MNNGTHLLIIDAQNDFMDLKPPAKPALPVPGAVADMDRLAQVIYGFPFDEITVTFDTQHAYGIERATYWRTPSGQPVLPFTEIRHAQVVAGEFLPRDPSVLQRTLATLAALEAGGKYLLRIWPPHGIPGTWGHLLYAPIQEAVADWEIRRMRPAYLVFKGMNPYTEAYSAIRAEVPDPDDTTTQKNEQMLATFRGRRLIVIGGEAGSHCDKATILDLLEDLGPTSHSRIVALRDCMSPVPGFEAEFAAFLADLHQRGVRVCTAAEFLANPG